MRPEGPVWQRRLMALRGMTCLALAWALPGSAAVVTNINIVDFAFQPSSVTVQVGDTVKWTWTGASSHSSTSDTSLWDSGVHGTGFVFTNSFAAAGNFPFHCSVHPFMTGSITVQAAATNSPPTIVTQPHSQAVAPGQDVTFTVSATGPPPLSFQWLFQGSEIVGATGSTLMLTNVQPANAGSYSVVVNNSFGSVTSSPAVLTVSAATTALVTVHINGHGTVHPNYDGQMLNVGMTYSMTAVPAADSVFAGWTGSISSQSPTLNFLVQSNMVFQANFSPASSSGIPGAYYGLFYDTNGVALSSSGGFRLVTTSRGTFSGVLQTAAGRYACSGQFDANGAASGVPARHGMSSLSLDLQLDLSPGGDEITGTVTGGSFNALLVGSRAVYSAGSNPAPQAGRYTMIIPGDPGSVAEPGGDSIGLVTVTSAGRIRLSALLADGARASQSSVLSREGQWPLFVPLKRGGGSLLSWVTFVGTPTNALSGWLNWIKGPNPGAGLYPNGFVLMKNVLGSTYAKPSPGAPVLALPSAGLLFTGGNLPEALTNEVALESNSRITVASNKLNMAFSVSSGLFHGTMLNPSTGKPVRFTGVALQDADIARGFFLGATQSGAVLLHSR